MHLNITNKGSKEVRVLPLINAKDHTLADYGIVNDDTLQFEYVSACNGKQLSNVNANKMKIELASNEDTNPVVGSTINDRADSDSNPIDAGLIGNTPFEGVCLWLHSRMLELGYICMVESASNNVPGFAPPLRGIIHTCRDIYAIYE